MINLADSLVESYMYADMFNREFEGGSDSGTDKIYGAGLPVEYIVPSLHPFSFKSPTKWAEMNETSFAMRNGVQSDIKQRQDYLITMEAK